MRIRHAKPADHARVVVARDHGRATVHCVTSPVNAGSLAFDQRLGVEIEAEVESYNGAGESRVLLVKQL